ncbi:hypothetical protein [Bifidobacterium biavatii]|uniref:Putative membrane protein n=1 Tax=Bifidobacterium biavatii DSM 23969 TaxID=1437608 RepID=A0A086ZZ57_9BIFI|nr:hypothetical protein [Bifidobacterium biavatii]KFI51807.1 putative membrane protein [Bifidobacterium biavatii DSM 23969]
MRGRIIRLAILVAVLVAVVGSFVMLSGLDAVAPLGVRGTVQVSGSTPSKPSSSTIAGVERTAGDTSADIVKLVEDIKDPGGARSMYVAVGDRSGELARWLADGYSGFTRSMTTTVLPFDRLSGQDPRGSYYVYGDPAATWAFAERFRTDGYEVDVKTDYTASYAQWLGNQPLGVSFAVTILLCAMLAGMFALMNVKGYAVQRLQGNSSWSVIARDVRANIRQALASILTVLLGFTGFLALYNHASHMGMALALAAGVFAVFLMVIVVAYLIGFMVASRSSLLASLKGRLPARLASGLIYCVRVPAVILAVWAVIYAGMVASQALDQAEAQQAWATAGQASAIRLNPRLSQDEQDRYAAATGQWLISQERQGRMILAEEGYTLEQLSAVASQTGSPMDGAASLSGNVLVVNSNYLHAQTVQDALGRRITRVPNQGVLVVIPASKQDQRERIENVVRAFIGSQSQMHGVATPRITVLTGKSGQSLFGYGQQNMPNQKTLFHDAVLVGVDSDTGIFSPDDYTAYASAGNAMLTDPDQALVSLREAGLQPFIYAVSSVSAKAAADFAKLQANLRIHLMNVLVAIAILIASAIAAAQTHVRGGAQRIFARYVHGWSFPATHRLAITMETMLALAPILFSTYQIIQSGLRAGTPTGAQNVADIYLLGGWQPAFIAAVTIVNILIYLLATARYERILAANHSREE